MQPPVQSPRRLGDYTNAPFEIFIVALSVLPFLLLAYFYPALPERVPVFLNLRGEVETWAGKSVLSVFRVPLMAVDTQLICLLAKYGTVASEAAAPLGTAAEGAESRGRRLGLGAGLWDWLRCGVAIKMGASSANTIFLSVERLGHLSRPAYVVTAAAALFATAGALYYGYRLFRLRGGAGEESGGVKIRKPVDARRVYGGLFYFDPSDPAMFARGYFLNFANRWSWALIACLAAYPLLVFLPS